MNQKNKNKDNYAIAEATIKKYKHSNKSLYKAILDSLPPLSSKNPKSTNLIAKAGDVMDSLGELSRKWTISIHWLYTICNPRIEKEKNIQYSPVYLDHADQLPLNRFGELTHLDDGDSLTQHGDKLLGDNRFIGAGLTDFGTAWNDAGQLINTDHNGNPVLDGFAKLISDYITAIQDSFVKKRNLDRHFQAFMIAHTRDIRPETRNSIPVHKPTHIHIVMDLPTNKSRYQMMQSMGFNFADLTDTFKWIKEEAPDSQNERIDAFLNTLQGAIKNYNIPDNYKASLQYLVHQSKAALQQQKTPYNLNEVISWLPNEDDTDYQHLANVFNNEVVADGINAEVLINLHSDFNTAHHTSRFVGAGKAVKLRDVNSVRKLARKRPGSFELTKHSKAMILKKVMQLIRQQVIQINDWSIVIHAALDDATADSLMSDQNFCQKINDLCGQEILAIENDDNYDRNMATIFITAASGGIGKTRLATALAKLYDRGRAPHFAATRDGDKKTYDAYQNYNNEQSSILDEVDPSAISWAQLKDLLDPHKIPVVSSRYQNRIPWNVKHTFLTNVYADGIGEYVKQVLHYAPGVAHLGYLKKDDNKNWNFKDNDDDAIKSYLSQLSQLLRRLPINIHMAPTVNGLGTRITVSHINFNPSGQKLVKYDYVYDEKSDHIFKRMINNDLPDSDMEDIATKVSKMIDHINKKANDTFKKYPGKLLSSENDFIECEANLGIKVRNGNYAFKNDKVDKLFNNDNSPKNFIDKLQHIEYSFWNPDDDNNDFNNKINQLDALLNGFKVPIKNVDYDDCLTIQLTENAKKIIDSDGLSRLLIKLNVHSIDVNDTEFFKFEKTSLISAIRLNQN